MCAAFDGDYPRARAIGEEALELALPTGDDALIGAAMGAVALGSVHAEVELMRQAGVHLRATGAIERRAQLFSTSGMAALSDDAYELSEQIGREALADALAIGDAFTIAFVNGNLGLATLLNGRHDDALAAFRAEVTISREHGFAKTFLFEGLLGLAALAAVDAEDERAATLEAAARVLSDRPAAPGEAVVYDRVDERYIAPARERLGDEAWQSAQAHGRAMTAETALDYALQTV